MKQYAITTHVAVENEALLIQCAREQYDRTNGAGTGAEEIRTVQQALDELSHLGAIQDAFFGGVRLLAPLDCGVEIKDRWVHCTHVGEPPQ